MYINLSILCQIFAVTLTPLVSVVVVIAFNSMLDFHTRRGQKAKRTVHDFQFYVRFSSLVLIWHRLAQETSFNSMLDFHAIEDAMADYGIYTFNSMLDFLATGKTCAVGGMLSFNSMLDFPTPQARGWWGCVFFQFYVRFSACRRNAQQDEVWRLSILCQIFNSTWWSSLTDTIKLTFNSMLDFQQGRRSIQVEGQRNFQFYVRFSVPVGYVYYAVGQDYFQFYVRFSVLRGSLGG